jgi:DNA-binding winged helix-turn-helix (wHTH) protein/Tfp pilus assembly protein PilF
VNPVDVPGQVRFGPWSAQRATGELSGPTGMRRLEPKVMDLLCLLAGAPGRVWTREELMQALWPGVVVGEDSLARLVSRLRQALDDDAKAPRCIETIARRGYRWIAPPADPLPVAVTPVEALPTPARDVRRRASLALVAVLALALAAAGLWSQRPTAPFAVAGHQGSAALLARADDHYFQFSRGSNEAAIELYQRVLALDPERPAAMAGLANALAQRAIRWPTAAGPDAPEFTRLGDALAHGHLAQEPARSQLQRARQLADAAVVRAPGSAAAHKALGLVASAQGQLDHGLAAHRRAVELDPDAWGAMINTADLLEQLGRADEALPWFERAFEAMSRDYPRNPAQVRGWHEALGVLVADRHRARGDLPRAEAWYRRVLAISPLQPEATRKLATLLAHAGDAAAAERLCRELQQRLGLQNACGVVP